MKNILGIVLALVVVGGGSFYGGMQYQQGKDSAAATAQRQGRQQFGGGGGGQRQGGGGRNGGAFAAGDIIAKDEKSVTVKLRDGGSMIVFFTDKTAIMKSAAGSLADLTVGAQVMASGSKNTDGSLTAAMIQLRPSQQQ